MRITEIKQLKNHQKAVELLRTKKIKVDSDTDISILWQYTGLVWLRPIVCNCDEYSDLIEVLNDIYNTYDTDNLPFRLWTYEEIEEGDLLEYMEEDFIPINGGEFYTDILSHVETIKY